MMMFRSERRKAGISHSGCLASVRWKLSLNCNGKGYKVSSTDHFRLCRAVLVKEGGRKDLVGKGKNCPALYDCLFQRINACPEMSRELACFQEVKKHETVIAN